MGKGAHATSPNACFIAELSIKTGAATKPHSYCGMPSAGHGKWVMFIASLVAISFLTLWPGVSGLTGTWALNLEKSEFGLATPKQVVVHLSQTGSHLAICRVTTDSQGKHVSFWEYNLTRDEVVRAMREPVVLRMVSIPGTPTDEEWRLISSGELIITRSVLDGSRTVDQRLVLKPSTGLVE
jgi:hypothetical protein